MISYANPVKPINAMARMPPTIRVMAVPLKALGTSHKSSSSRIPAMITMAMVNPTPPNIPSARALPRSHACSGLSTPTMLAITVRQANKMAQLVVINGRKTPKVLYSDG